MSDSDISDASAALCDFLDLWLSDRSAGRPRPLSDYLKRFPGHEEHIAREFLALVATSRADAGGPAAVPSADLLGHYRLLEKLGQGGQGTVYRAEDVRLERQVALKILDGALGGLPATRAARLRREAAALSRLDHPRLCALYDADLDGERPYFAMRYVAGETLAQRIERARGVTRPGATAEGLLARMPQTTREIDDVLRFVEEIARAIHVAHEAGIIHRDLKPGNVMIDAGGDPVVLDFGLARDLHSDAHAITLTGDAFGTLAYMAPEQLEGGRDLDRRTDVYALGVTLFECLTLRRPVETATRELLFRDVIAGRHQDPVLLNRALPRDLAVVLSLAIDVDRDRRYPTALALAEDLRRIREHEPILARPAGIWTLARRFRHRHPAAFAGGAAALLLLVAGLIITITLLARVTREQAQTRLEQTRLLALRQASLAQVVASEKPALALRAGIEAARRAPHPEINTILYDLLDRCYVKQTFLVGGEGHRVALGFDLLTDARGNLLVGYAGGIATFDLKTGARKDLLSGQAESAAAGTPRLGLNSTRDTLASVHEDGSLRIWSLGAEPSLRDEKKVLGAPPMWLEWSPDDSRIAIACRDGEVVVHDARPKANRQARLVVPGRSITTARFSPTGRWLVATGLSKSGQPLADHGASVFDADSGALVAGLGPPGTHVLWSAWSAAGDRLAIAFDASVRVFRTSDWEEEASFPHSDRVYWLAFEPGDRRIVTGSREGVAVFDLQTRARIATVGDFRERSVIRGAFSPDGSRLAVISWDQTASIIACDGWQEVRKLKGLGRPRGVCWSAGGNEVVISDEASMIHVFFAGDRPHLPILRGHDDRVVSASFDGEGRRVVTASLDGRARVFSAEGGGALRVFEHGAPLQSAAFVSDIVLTVGGGRVAAWDPEAGTRLHEIGNEGAKAVAVVPVSGTEALVTFDDGTARLWRMLDGVTVRAFGSHEGPVLCAAVHRATRRIATGGADRAVRIYDLDSGATVATFTFANRSPSPAGTDLSRVFALTFDLPGNRIIAGCEDLHVRMWNVRTGRLERDHSTATPGHLAVDPTGRWLMSASKWLGRVSFLDLADAGGGINPAPLPDSHMIAAAGFSPVGGLAMAASKDGAVRLWATGGMQSVGVLDARCGILLDAAFSPDSKRLVVAGSDRTARIWPVDPLEVAERVIPFDDVIWELLRPTLDQALSSISLR